MSRRRKRRKRKNPAIQMVRVGLNSMEWNRRASGLPRAEQMFAARGACVVFVDGGAYIDERVRGRLNFVVALGCSGLCSVFPSTAAGTCSPWVGLSRSAVIAKIMFFLNLLHRTELPAQVCLILRLA